MSSLSRSVVLSVLSASVQAATLLSRDSPTNKHTGLPTEDTAHPPNAHYNPETEIHESFPFSVEVLVAFGWILFVGSVPVILLRIQGRGVTKTYYGLCGCMYISLFFGLYLFTHIVMFNAYHWPADKPRALTLVECVYFMATVISTVGYGDITPAFPRGQIFVGIYVICSILVISILISDFVGHCLSGMEASIDRRARRVPEGEEPTAAQERCMKKSWMHTPTAPCYWKLCLSFFVYLFFAITFTIFFSTFPGEDKTVAQSAYMSLITLSTVGFGAFYPLTEGGKAFLAFYMVFGAISLANVIGEFSAYCQCKREAELFTDETNKLALEQWQASNGQDKMTEAEFLKFWLVNQGKIAKDEVNRFSEAFNSMADRTEGGGHRKLTMETLSRSFSRSSGWKEPTEGP
jgi:hypothetical protein